MKPLPFDMTPLTRSLNLAPLSRPGSAAVGASTAPRAGGSGDSADTPRGAPGPDSTGSETAFDIHASTVEYPPSQDSGGAPDGSADLDEKRGTKTAGRTSGDKKSLVGRGATAPIAELRTGTYPRPFSSGRTWKSRLALEQIHALATHILARHTERNLRSLAITSALAGEGKTTVSLALAEKLAQSGKRILIIDLDAHRATLSRECGLEDAAGAIQSSDPRDPTNSEFHAYDSDIPGISIMPAGYPESGSMGPPIVSPVHVGVLLLRGLDEYDFVLLDCPPLLPVADTHVIGEVVDKALLVVRAGSTPRDMIDQAVDEFGRDKFLGAVLNRSRPQDIPYFRELYGYYRRDNARG